MNIIRSATVLTALLAIVSGALICEPARGDTAPASANDASQSFAARLHDSYKLGRLIQEPVVSVLYLDDTIKELARYLSDADSSQAIVADAKIAATTRSTETIAYADAAKLLADMSAPPGVRSSCDTAIKTLNGDLAISSDAAKAANDPEHASDKGLCSRFPGA